MSFNETIRARIELPCSIRVRGSNFGNTSGVTEEISRESLIVLVSSVSFVKLLSTNSEIVVAIELPHISAFRPRVLECEATVSRVRRVSRGLLINSEILGMTVVGGNPKFRIESKAAIERSRKHQQVIRMNHPTHTKQTHTIQGEHTMSFLKNLFVEEDGQDMVEYGLVLALVVLAAVGVFTTLGTNITTGFGILNPKVANAIK
jgi:pilus assembly protein Flp/PilA